MTVNPNLWSSQDFSTSQTIGGAAVVGPVPGPTVGTFGTYATFSTGGTGFLFSVTSLTTGQPYTIAVSYALPIGSQNQAPFEWNISDGVTPITSYSYMPEPIFQRDSFTFTATKPTMSVSLVNRAFPYVGDAVLYGIKLELGSTATDYVEPIYKVIPGLLYNGNPCYLLS